MCGGNGTIQSERALSHRVQSFFWTGPLRGPERLQNTFAHESFIDEVAARVQVDPVAYRLRYLSDPRLSDVLKAAANAAGWTPRPSPKAVASGARIASGRGIAIVAYDGGEQGYGAMVAEVDVDQTTGAVTVTRLVVSQDCGPISNPDGLRNQMEGGALHGMSRALLEEVTWDSRKITSVDWKTYRSLPVGFKIPRIETVLINRVDDEATGAGETTICMPAAAIANAIFDATGVRLRQVPFTPERVKAALGART
jgi:CO/xanthine dehydrogenase Mo-binding subunit